MVDQILTPEAAFPGEQDGPEEQRLKEALSVLLRLNPSVTRAYLLHDRRRVMLGVLTENEKENEKLVEQVERAFAALFNTAAHLDILFLSENRDAEIRRTFPPFYNRYAAWQA